MDNIKDILAIMQSEKPVRRAIVKRSPRLFFLYYFGHYVEYLMAPFHSELFGLMQDDEQPMQVVSAFRNSGKSTILTMSYPIWAIISGKAKFILVVSENLYKAQTLLGHIKAELTENELLKNDLGPFQEERIGFTLTALTLNKYGAKIMAVSTEQSVRGLRHLNHRPDLIILDDCESQDTVRTQESRDKLSEWLSGDVIPAGHSKTKVVVIGSMLHLDSLIPRLQKSIDSGAIRGEYHMTPILGTDGNPTWPGKFPNLEAIEAEKSRGISERDWLIEYMLTPLVSEDQVIKAEDLRYYDRLPSSSDPEYQYVASGVDLAIAQTATADCTAIVSGIVTRDDNGWKLYILPHPVNEKLSGAEVEDRIVHESLRLGNGQPTPTYIENVGYQQFMVERIIARGIPAEGFSPGGHDKRARLITASALIKCGQVLLPKHYAEKLINQVLYFGSEKHDDLLDAFVILILKLCEREESGRLFIPKPYERPIAPSQEEAEREADEMASLWQQALRGDQYSLNRYNELEQKYRKDYWDAEALKGYGALMRDSFRRRRGY